MSELDTNSVGVVIEEHDNGKLFLVWDTTRTEKDRYNTSLHLTPPWQYGFWAAETPGDGLDHIEYSFEGTPMGSIRYIRYGRRAALLEAAREYAEYLAAIGKGLPIITRLLPRKSA